MAGLHFGGCQPAPDGWLALRGTDVGRPGAREAPLGALAGVGTPCLPVEVPLHAWRGRSGRRYVVSVYPLDHADDGYRGALLLAVTRRADGARELVAACESGAMALTGFNGQWLSAARERGANELHVHLLAATREARRETLDDLL